MEPGLHEAVFMLSWKEGERGEGEREREKQKGNVMMKYYLPSLLTSFRVTKILLHLSTNFFHLVILQLNLTHLPLDFLRHETDHTHMLYRTEARLYDP